MTTGIFAWALLGGVLAAATLRALGRIVSYRSGGRAVIFLLAWAFAPVAVVGAALIALGVGLERVLQPLTGAGPRAEGGTALD